METTDDRRAKLNAFLGEKKKPEARKRAIKPPAVRPGGGKYNDNQPIVPWASSPSGNRTLTSTRSTLLRSKFYQSRPGSGSTLLRGKFYQSRPGSGSTLLRGKFYQSRPGSSLSLGPAKPPGALTKAAIEEARRAGSREPLATRAGKREPPVPRVSSREPPPSEPTRTSSRTKKAPEVLAGPGARERSQMLRCPPSRWNPPHLRAASRRPSPLPPLHLSAPSHQPPDTRDFSFLEADGLHAFGLQEGGQDSDRRPGRPEPGGHRQDKRLSWPPSTWGPRRSSSPRTWSP